MMKVSDTGTGMDKQTLAHVFEPFFTTKPMGKGTGLGLSTVYGIVQQAGGEIEVQSEPGKGTTFRIYLPRAQSSPGRQPKPKAPRPAAGTETILLAEDNPEVRQALAGLLRSNRYQVLEARDGEQAWNLFRANRDRIDLLISDVIMTGMSGKELARRITEQWPKTKILFVSGYAHSLITKSEFQNPKVQFLQKPFKLEAFLEQVRGLLAK